MLFYMLNVLSSHSIPFSTTSFSRFGFIFKGTCYFNVKLKQWYVDVISSLVYCPWYIWTTSRENRIFMHANNKSADQPAHPHSLVIVFVIRYLEMAICYIQIFNILSSLCNWADWNGSCLPGNEAQLYTVSSKFYFREAFRENKTLTKF